MKKFIVYIIGIFLIILENSVINYIDIFGTSPGIVLPFLVLVSLYMEDYEAGIAGVVMGLLKDMTVGGIFGMNAVLLSTICYLIGHFRRNFYRESTSMVMGLLFISSAAYSIVYASVAYFMYFTDGILIILLRAVVILPLLNTGIGFIIYKLFNSSIMKLKEE